MAGERVIGGRYAVGRKIAEGGMGTVYEGTHMLSKKIVALKLLNPEVGRDETTRQRFLREVAAPAQIGHDGIVEIYDAGFDPIEGILFVAMELLSGITLRDRLIRGGIPPHEVLDLFDQMLQPLAAAHRAGIVHRDLKPENVFLATKRDGTEVVKILDFGIARDLAGQDTVTQAGTAMGTPHYMSPEQAMSARDVTFSTDVWALGVMFYEALSGSPPFSGETIATIVVEICTKPHRPLAEVTHGLPPALTALVDRCLDKNASHRPANAGELLLALRQARGGSVAPSPTATADLSTTKADPNAASPTGALTAPARAAIPMTAAMPIASSQPSSPALSPPSFGAPSFGAPLSSSLPTPPVPMPLGTPPAFGAPTPPAAPYLPPTNLGPTPPMAHGLPAGMGSQPSLPGASAVPAPAAPKNRWIAPVAILGGLGCLATIGLGVVVTGLAVLGSMVGGDAEVDADLSRSDSLVGNGSYGDTYEYDWSAGDHVVISLTSPDFDTVLVLRTPGGGEMINDDVAYPDLNSRIDTVLTESGTYRVVATSYASGATGRYHLSVQHP